MLNELYNCEIRVRVVRTIAGLLHLEIHTVIRSGVFALDMTMVISDFSTCVHYECDGNQMCGTVYVVWRPTTNINGYRNWLRAQHLAV